MNERTSDRHINNHICGRVWKPGKSSLPKKANLSGKPLKGTSKNQRCVHHRPGELVRDAASQAPLQTHWVRIYPLKRHSGDSQAHHGVRSMLSGPLLPLYSRGGTAGGGWGALQGSGRVGTSGQVASSQVQAPAPTPPSARHPPTHPPLPSGTHHLSGWPGLKCQILPFSPRGLRTPPGGRRKGRAGLTGLATCFWV